MTEQLRPGRIRHRIGTQPDPNGGPVLPVHAYHQPVSGHLLADEPARRAVTAMTLERALWLLKPGGVHVRTRYTRGQFPDPDTGRMITVYAITVYVAGHPRR